VVLYLFSNSFLLDEAMRLWEMPVVNLSKSEKHYDYVVILGGMMSYYDTHNKQIGFNRSVDRLMQGLKIINQKKANKIIFTGGDGSILKTIGREGDCIKQYLMDIGFNTDSLTIESDSQNTFENATYTAALLKKQPKATIILVTSAFHMRRALACFRKQGLHADYYPADRYAGKRKYTLDHLFIPQIEAMEKWSLLVHEISGFLIYKIMGYA
jgi:uncharacterized SAM-binding protein YcdF (DUF218 family)